MLKKPLLINNSLSVTFQTKIDIRRNLGDFEDFLCNDSTSFNVPSLMPVPDDIIDFNIPRIIVETKHGFSQIVATQNMVSINTRYSPDFQQDFSKCEDYINKHSATLFALLKKIKRKPFFCGFVSAVQIGSKSLNDDSIIKLISEKYSIGHEVDNLFDIDLKLTHAVEKKYFKNIRIQNYRSGKTEHNPYGVPKFPVKDATQRGIQVILDFNDRYSYNEKETYVTDKKTCGTIIKESFILLNKEVDKIIR